eukprot:jgi/Psemu1/301753/fgenesh1_kg.43_\
MMADYAENDGDEEGGWEDIEEDEEGGKGAVVETMTTPRDGFKETDGEVPHEEETNAKRQKLNESANLSDTNVVPTKESGDGSNDEPDSYVTYMDPDHLEAFLEITRIKSDQLHDGTAFFLLMTFPFYEQEWDLVGFLLEEIFGDGGDE